MEHVKVMHQLLCYRHHSLIQRERAIANTSLWKYQKVELDRTLRVEVRRISVFKLQRIGKPRLVEIRENCSATLLLRSGCIYEPL